MTIDLSHYQTNFDTSKFEDLSDGILRITFETAAPMNPMSPKMHNHVAYVWRDIDLDVNIKAVIVRGAGKGFSAGGDFNLINDMIQSDNALLKTWKECKDLVYNIINCSKPIISAIHGPAVGAGLAVALLADIPIATKTAKLIDSHTKLGVAAGDFSAIIWPLLCGMAKTKYYLLTGKPVNGEEAERIGLVALCVEDDELHDTALDVARNVAGNSPLAVRWTKHSLNNWLRMMGPSFDNSLALEMFGFRLPDIQEGLSAMQEKRPTNFSDDCPV